MLGVNRTIVGRLSIDRFTISLLPLVLSIYCCTNHLKAQKTMTTSASSPSSTPRSLSRPEPVFHSSAAANTTFNVIRTYILLSIISFYSSEGVYCLPCQSCPCLSATGRWRGRGTALCGTAAQPPPAGPPPRAQCLAGVSIVHIVQVEEKLLMCSLLIWISKNIR